MIDRDDKLPCIPERPGRPDPGDRTRGAQTPEYGPQSGPLRRSSYQDYYTWVKATGEIVSTGRASFNQIPGQSTGDPSTETTPGLADPAIHSVDLGDPPNLSVQRSMRIDIGDDDGFAPHSTTIKVNRRAKVTIYANGEALAQYDAVPGVDVGVTFHFGALTGTKYHVAAINPHASADAFVNVVKPIAYAETGLDDVNVPVPLDVINAWREEARENLMQLLAVMPDTLDELKVSFRALLKLTIAEDFLAEILSVAPPKRPIRDRRP